jgi:hypothetical protein
LLPGSGLNDAARGGRQVERLEIARAQGIGQHFELLGGGLLAIDDHKVFVAQAAGSAARSIANFTKDPFTAHFEADPSGGIAELINQLKQP